MEIEHIFAVFFKQGSAGSPIPFKEIGMKVPFPVCGMGRLSPLRT
jgi:hypothetical protein